MRSKVKVNQQDGGWIVRIVGALLLVASLGLVAYNERRVMDYAAASERHGAPVLDLGAAGRPEAGQYGSMTRVSGTPQIVDAPRDPEFNVRAESPVLIRHVEMFQWRELSVGGSTHYELDWVDHPIDASEFAHPQGHVNPGAFPVQGRQFDAGEVRMGHFRLSTPLLRAFPDSVRVPPEVEHLPANLAATFQKLDDTLVTSAKPGQPRLGDLRVSWEAVPLQSLTVLARIDGDTLVPATNGSVGGAGFDVQVGERSLLDVLPSLPEPPQAVLPLRILAILLAAFGGLLLAHRSRLQRDALFALGVGGVVVSAIAGVMWLGGDSMTASVWLLVAVLAAGLAIWRVQRLQGA
ncbi:uncharacterized protein DUF1625 [Luteibacter rhizovicinus]|uniref:Uncharacterized protein DUF1625 n=1 Tax=Luteibacter rhizovicinus TaxID=242606 RepID=A0A4R3YP75_9GAMM|nr:TMEM43 family protein [Luteibacter rhizovicinus]TCV94126.1 uncharacterized protein DUF1625 [Luteibacter rhizovicinus]